MLFKHFKRNAIIYVLYSTAGASISLFIFTGQINLLADENLLVIITIFVLVFPYFLQLLEFILTIVYGISRVDNVLLFSRYKRSDEMLRNSEKKKQLDLHPFSPLFIGVENVSSWLSLQGQTSSSDITTQTSGLGPLSHPSQSQKNA